MSTKEILDYIKDNSKSAVISIEQDEPVVMVHGQADAVVAHVCSLIHLLSERAGMSYAETIGHILVLMGGVEHEEASQHTEDSEGQSD